MISDGRKLELQGKTQNGPDAMREKKHPRKEDRGNHAIWHAKSGG